MNGQRIQSLQGDKYGDPIADGFMGIVHPNCAVLCVTGTFRIPPVLNLANAASSVGPESSHRLPCTHLLDGCGWGNKARLASRFALASFVDHVSSRLLTVIDLESAASLLLDAVKYVRCVHCARVALVCSVSDISSPQGCACCCIPDRCRVWRPHYTTGRHSATCFEWVRRRSLC